jgi:acetyltransferase-like isoleucine patch superfamily enzyme
MEDTHFNTNCGDIYIGDYTFCGGFVKIITGSHDYKRVGKERQLSVPTSGNDIHIGNGVWLCANATILGPCRIHDNAVIAAGAVVIPGTEVPKNTIWGAPAKHIKTIELSIHS